MSQVGIGKKTGIGTTEARLVPSSTQANEVLITAAPGNSANVRVGVTGIADDTGAYLAPGDAIRIRVTDLSSVYVKAESGTQAVSFLYEYA